MMSVSTYYLIVLSKELIFFNIKYEMNISCTEVLVKELPVNTFLSQETVYAYGLRCVLKTF